MTFVKSRIEKYLPSKKLVLAPLQGMSTQPFRQLCRKYGAGLVYIPMIHVERFIHDVKRLRPFLEHNERDKPVALQLIGNDPEMFKSSLDVLNSFNYIIDINLGCPSVKARRANRGGYLLKKPDLVRKIAQSLTKYSINPVSAKIRVGWDEKSINAPEIAAILESEGIELLAVHGKTVSAGYRIGVNLEIIRVIKDQAGIPIIGNGECFVASDVENMLQSTNCDYVMIGRASMGNPFIFQQCQSWLETGRELERTTAIVKQMVQEFNDLIIKVPVSSERVGFPDLKVFCVHAVKSIRGATKLRQTIMGTKSTDELLEFISSLNEFSNDLPRED